MESLVEEITIGDEILKNVSFSIMLSSYLKEELINETENKVKEICRQHNLGVESNYLNQQDAFEACLPKIKDENNISKQLIASTSLAAFFPFLIPNYIDETGLCLGNISNGYLFFDLFLKNKERVNSNMFILGTSGSGKSFFSKKLINQRILMGDKVFIIDPEREYQFLATSNHGN
jgi:type IV secretory pathway VirB4 component